MKSNITSLINKNAISVNFLLKGLTKVFTDKKEAELFAKETRSYYYPALLSEGNNEEIIYCVPK